MATRRYDVTAGPNKFDLMLALFEEKEVLFTLKGVKGPLKSLVTSIGLYSKEEEKYEIRGQLVPQDWQDFYANPTPYDFHGFFDCRKRTGILDFQAEACWKEQLDKEMDACWQALDEEQESDVESDQCCKECGNPLEECTCLPCGCPAPTCYCGGGGLDIPDECEIYPRDNG